MYLKEEVGTTVYLSPEQVNHTGLYDYKIDIWAFGWFLYYITAHKPPFRGTTYSDLSYNIINTDPNDLPEECSKEYISLINRALTKSPKDRPTAIELCLLIPATIIHNYSAPNKPTLASLTFMNPTKSTMGRQKSTSKRTETIETLKARKSRKNKFKTPKRINCDSIYKDPYSAHSSSFVKVTPITEK